MHLTISNCVNSTSNWLTEGTNFYYNEIYRNLSLSLDNHMPTVTVTPIEGCSHVLLMDWESAPKHHDVSAAFQAMMHYLDDAAHKIHVVVNLLDDPKITALETARNALFGPQRHRNMGDWLVVGSSPLAKLVETMMTTFSSNNVYWFSTLEEALAFAEKLPAKSA